MSLIKMQVQLNHTHIVKINNLNVTNAKNRYTLIAYWVTIVISKNTFEIKQSLFRKSRENMHHKMFWLMNYFNKIVRKDKK